MVSAEMISIGVSMTREPEDVLAHIQRQAPGLSRYIGQYLKDVVMPFNDDLTARGLQSESAPDDSIDPNKLNAIIFTEAALMTFKMTHGVYMNTGAEIPAMTGNTGRVALRPSGLETEDVPLIDAYFRGQELRDRLPHLYRPVLALMAGRTGVDAAELDADLSLPLARHRDATLGIRELHFIGGAAETVLPIEDSASLR
jgi:hypothetical protein